MASRLLGLDRHRALPHWLVASFKRVAPAALLHLWMDYGLLSSAAQLVCEYIDAILGVRATEFAIKVPTEFVIRVAIVAYSCFALKCTECVAQQWTCRVGAVFCL